MKNLPRVSPRKPSAGKSPPPSETVKFAAENPAQFDNRSVTAFAYAMRIKLAVKRLDGRGGWQDKEHCSNEYLSKLLREHVEKGDPVDVANFCMMLHQRGELIASPAASKPLALAEAAYDLASWAGCINWRGGENQKDWLDELRQHIERVRQLCKQYRGGSAQVQDATVRREAMNYVSLRTYTTPHRTWGGQHAAEISVGNYRCTLEGAPSSEQAIVEALGLVYRAFPDTTLLEDICAEIAPQDRDLAHRAIENEKRWRPHGAGR